MTEIDMTKPLSKETEALMALQYDGMSHSHVKNKIKLKNFNVHSHTTWLIFWKL